MKEFFTKSNVYKKYVQEYQEEKIDNQEAQQVESQLSQMKNKMRTLSAKYDSLNATIKDQQKDA